MQKVEFTSILERIIPQLYEGAFLISGKGESANPMTIGWAQFGIIWSKPICTVFVRQSRFSHEMMESCPTFTVSIPLKGEMKKELSFCGSKSGRSTSKLAELSLSVTDTENEGQCLEKCIFHIVCRTVAKTEMDMQNVDKAILDRFYNTNQATADGDPHTIYFGEIIEAFAE